MKALLLAIGLLLSAALITQTPHIEGSVRIEKSKGLLEASMTITNLPAETGTNYRILLHRGLTIKQLFAGDEMLSFRGHYNGEMFGESVGYVPVSGRDTVPLPDTMRISYAGAYPVYREDEYAAFDYKGVIAVTEKTFRATEQSKWYPVIYDLDKDEMLTKVTYNLSVECPDCQSIYLNGDVPKAGGDGHFMSASPVPLLLFAGDFEFTEYVHAFHINSPISPEEAELFDELLGEIQTFYAGNLGIDYGKKPCFMQHAPLEKYTNPDRMWGFATYPTFAYAGRSYNTTLDLRIKAFVRPNYYSFFAHELAHYYFGDILRPNSTLFWFFLESMAEYLAMKATRHELGEDLFQENVSRKVQSLQKSISDEVAFVPLAKVRTAGTVHDSYRYYLGPLYLLAVEKRIGEDLMYDALQFMLNDQNQVSTDYAYLGQVFRQIGITANSWKEIERSVLEVDVEEFLKAEFQ